MSFMAKKQHPIRFFVYKYLLERSWPIPVAYLYTVLVYLLRKSKNSLSASVPCWSNFLNKKWISLLPKSGFTQKLPLNNRLFSLYFSIYSSISTSSVFYLRIYTIRMYSEKWWRYISHINVFVGVEIMLIVHNPIFFMNNKLFSWVQISKSTVLFSK